MDLLIVALIERNILWMMSSSMCTSFVSFCELSETSDFVSESNFSSLLGSHSKSWEILSLKAQEMKSFMKAMMLPVLEIMSFLRRGRLRSDWGFMVRSSYKLRDALAISKSTAFDGRRMGGEMSRSETDKSPERDLEMEGLEEST
ncbi:hypothetical protein P9112_006188 [Eukaryota sp. TZLM1-RC]